MSTTSIVTPFLLKTLMDESLFWANTKWIATLNELKTSSDPIFESEEQAVDEFNKLIKQMLNETDWKAKDGIYIFLKHDFADIYVNRIEGYGILWQIKKAELESRIQSQKEILNSVKNYYQQALATQWATKQSQPYIIKTHMTTSNQ